MSSASKINGSRHGLLSQTVVLEEESTTRFEELLTGYMDEYQPATASQVSLVETMAVARWRQLRVWGAQKTAMDRDMALQDPNIGPAPPDLSPRHPIWPNLERRKYLHCGTNLPST